MTESAMFTDDYPATLPLAPRVFKPDELINSADMPLPAGLWEKRPGFLGEYEVKLQDMPNVTWRVVMVFQLLKGGGGHIRARSGKFLVEWHFRSNAALTASM